MKSRVKSHLRVVLALTFAAAAFPFTPVPSWGQSPPSRFDASAAFGESPAADSLNVVLETGRALEAKRQWASVLNHYEDALRAYPTHEVLRRRHDLAKMQYSLARRYSDTSFQSAVRTADPTQAAALLSEVLAKIDSHYVVNRPGSRRRERHHSAWISPWRAPRFSGKICPPSTLWKSTSSAAMSTNCSDVRRCVVVARRKRPPCRLCGSRRKD